MASEQANKRRRRMNGGTRGRELTEHDAAASVRFSLTKADEIDNRVVQWVQQLRSGMICLHTNNGIELLDLAAAENDSTRRRTILIGREAHRSALSSDESRIFVHCFESNEIIVVALAIGKIVLSVKMFDVYVWTLAVSKCGHVLAAGTGCSQVVLFNAGTMREIKRQTVGTNELLDLAFSDKFLFAASRDGHGYCLDNQHLTVNWKVHLGLFAYCVSFSADQTLVVAGAADGKLKVMLAEDGGAVVADINVGRSDVLCAYFMSSRHVVVSDRKDHVAIWDLSSRTILQEEHGGERISLSADSTRLVFVGVGLPVSIFNVHEA